MYLTASARFRGLSHLVAYGLALSALATALTWAGVPAARLLWTGAELDYQAALGVAAAVGGWLVLGWFAGCLLLALLARLPGHCGRLAGRAARAVTPALLRRSLEVGLGTTLTLAAGTSFAHAETAAPLGSTANGADTGAAEQHPLPRPDRPATRPDDPKRGAPEVVVVRRGDTLWDIAASELPGRPSVAEIARQWPRWYAANRSTIGADPNLIHPGQRLRTPNR